MQILARILTRHYRSLAILLTLATCLALCGIRLVNFESDSRAVWANDADRHRLAEFAAKFGSDDQQVTFVLQANDFFKPATMGRLREFALQLSEQSGVEAVFSIFDARRRGSLRLPLMPRTDAPPARYERAREEALNHPLVANQLLSADGRTMLVVVQLIDGGTRLNQLSHTVDQLDALAVNTFANSEIAVFMTGSPPLAVESLRNVQGDQVKLGVVSTVLAMGLAWLLLGNVTEVAMAVIGPAVGAVWTMGMMGFMGTPLSGINSVVVTIIFVVGFANAIHFVLARREAQASHADLISAVQESWATVAPASGMAALTSAIGFGSLCFAQTPSIQSFGKTCAMGTMLSGLAVLTATPAIALFGRRYLLVAQPTGWLLYGQRRIGQLGEYVLRYRQLIAISGILGAIALAYFAAQLRPNQRTVDTLPTHSASRRGFVLADEAFGGSLPVRIHVSWTAALSFESDVLQILERAHGAIESQQEVSSPVSVLTVLQSLATPDTTLDEHVDRLDEIPTKHRARLVRQKDRELVISARIRDIGGQHTLAALGQLQERCEQIERDFGNQVRLKLAGYYYQSQRSLSRLIADLARSLVAASLLIFPWMAIAFRNWRLALICLVPNLLPLLFSASILVWTSQPLSVASAVTFSFCLGIAVDDTIHFLMRYQKSLRGGNEPLDALRIAFQTVGTAMLASTIVFVAGFAVIGLSTMPPLRLLSAMCCCCFVAALCGDLVLLPALLAAANTQRSR